MQHHKTSGINSFYEFSLYRFSAYFIAITGSTPHLRCIVFLRLPYAVDLTKSSSIIIVIISLEGHSKILLLKNGFSWWEIDVSTFIGDSQIWADCGLQPR
jgi:hypothetical protein